MKGKFQYVRRAGTRLEVAIAYLFAAFVFLHAPSLAFAQNVVWIRDGYNLPEHRLRGKAIADTHLNAGVLKFYVPVCTFPVADRKDIRSYEIRKALYRTSGIIVMANLCNDLLPNGTQQMAFVAGYNSVMDLAITKRLGPEWKEMIEKKVKIQLLTHPKGKLRARDIDFETPY